MEFKTSFRLYNPPKKLFKFYDSKGGCKHDFNCNARRLIIHEVYIKYN